MDSDPTAGQDGRDEAERLRTRVRELEARLENAEAALVLANERINDFAQSSAGWFWEMDAQLRFTYFSPTVYDITGITPEWHYGKTREELGAHGSVTNEQWQSHLEQLQRREPFDGFEFLREGPATSNWMETSGVPVFGPVGEFLGYRGVATDITERMEAETRADQLMSAIENLDESIVLWSRDDKLVVCNAHFREINDRVVETTMPGVRFEDHIRAALAAGLYPQANGHEDEWLAQRLRNHRNPVSAFELERQDGRWLLVREQRLPDGSTATTSTDITQRKLAELELERHRSHLEQLVQERTAHLEAANQDIKRFTYLVSHDLRAPLVNITGFTQELSRDRQALQALLASEKTQLGEAQRKELSRILDESIPEATGFIEAAASRMDRQTRALLEYSRLGRRELRPERLDLSALSHEYLKTIAHQVEAAEVEIDVSTMPCIIADRLSVEQVLGNLLDNAVKYLDPTRAARVSVHAQRRGSEVVVAVTDTGRGVAPRNLERIFDVFTRANAGDVEGEGMGLAYVRALIARLGGRAWCESSPGQGSTFRVSLPINYYGARSDPSADRVQHRTAAEKARTQDGEVRL